MNATSVSHRVHIKAWLAYTKAYHKQLWGALFAIILTAGSVLLLGKAMGYLIDEGISKHNDTLLDLGLCFVVITILLLAFGSFLRFYLVTFVSEHVVTDIKQDLYRHLLQLPTSYFEHHKSGEILSRLTTDTTLLQTIISSSFSVALRNGIMLVGGLTMMITTSATLAAIVAGVILFVVIPIVILGKRVRMLSKIAQAKLADVTTHIEETIQGIKTVQAYTREHLENQIFETLNSDALTASKKRIILRAALTAIVISFVFGAVAFVLWVGGYQVIAGHISTGELSSFIFYAIVVAGSAGSISEVVGDVQRGLGAMERLSELKQEPVAIYYRTETHALPHNTQASLTFSNVSFHYPSKPNHIALPNFNIQIEEGETVALVGPSGGGKSTLFELILRYYDPQAGTILIGDQPIDQININDVRRYCGIVPQHPVIFSDTAFENIRIGKPEASAEEIYAAAKAAACYEFISELPKGFDTYLGEKGVRLSGGERQRVAIARIFLKNPRILLLDEATSALDTANEQLVQAAFERLMKNRTCLVISHRLSTIQKADRIVVIDKGHIVETGTHHSLIAQDGLYAHLAKLQFNA